LDLILLIFKLLNKALSLGLIFYFSSCTRIPLISGSHNQQDKKKALKKSRLEINQSVSPTKKIMKNGFFDRTEEYGLSGFEAVTINAIDINRDGWSDLVFLPNYYSRPKFLIFDSKIKKFVLWNHDPLPMDFKASYLLFNDVNKDGIIDLISAVFNQKSEVSKVPIKFFKGIVKDNKLYFDLVLMGISVAPTSTSAVSILDYDLDGWPDLFLSNWFEFHGNEVIPVADRLLRNKLGMQFEDVSHLLKGEHSKLPSQLYPTEAKPTYGASTCDIDQNGFPDILTVSSNGYKNKLWMNKKNDGNELRFFEDVGEKSGYASDESGSLLPTGGGRTFFSACVDYNDDGIMDVFLGELSHGHDNDSVDKSSILTGSKLTYPPYFIRTEYLSEGDSQHWNQGDRRAIWLDYNLDGQVDLLVENSGFPPYSRLVMFEQQDDHAFVNVASNIGIDVVNPGATVILDVNRDGKWDILTSQNNIRDSKIKPRFYLFENNIEPKGTSLKINLVGKNSNIDGVGAKISLVLVSRNDSNLKKIQTRWVEYSQGGLPSQNEKGVIFGIPKNFKPVEIQVFWPSLKKNGNKKIEINKKIYPLKNLSSNKKLEFTLNDL